MGPKLNGKGKMQTQRGPHEDGTETGVTATGHGGERHGMGLPSEPPNGANPAGDALVLDFWLLEL